MGLLIDVLCRSAAAVSAYAAAGLALLVAAPLLASETAWRALPFGAAALLLLLGALTSLIGSERQRWFASLGSGLLFMSTLIVFGFSAADLARADLLFPGRPVEEIALFLTSSLALILAIIVEAFVADADHGQARREERLRRVALEPIAVESAEPRLR